MRCCTEHTLHAAFTQVKGYFSIHRVIHRTCDYSPEVFLLSTLYAQPYAQVRLLMLTFRRTRGTISSVITHRTPRIVEIIIIP